MALNNLRILYKNIADSPNTTLEAPFNGPNPVTNLKTDIKSSTWKSATVTSNITTNILATIGTQVDGINTVAFLYSNLSDVATIRVLGYNALPVFSGTAAAPIITGTATYDVTLNCMPYTSNVNLNEWAGYSYSTNSYGLDKNLARVWLPTLCTSPYIVIQINDSSLTYIEASRLILGKYWSPMYNTGYGVSKGISDTSSNERTEAGDLVSIPGQVFQTMTFDMEWMTNADRLEMVKVLKFNGKRKGIFISLFPNNTLDYEKEKEYQMYGKLSDTSAIVHPVLDIYSTSISIEEI